MVLALAPGCGPAIGATLNRVRSTPRPTVSSRAAAIHAASSVVDLHADSLLWKRDLLQRSRFGHVDVPRLREGGVALQVFAMTTRFPIVPHIAGTDPRWPDAITLLAAVSLWPLRTLGNIEERALYEADRLRRFAAASDGGLVVVDSRTALEAVLARRAGDPRVVGGLLALEGAYPIEGDAASLDRVFAAGVHMVGLTHFYDTRFAGSAHGIAKGGLTDAGRALVRELERRGVVVDLAHTSAATIADVLAIATHPVVVSHTGLRATCDNPRNLSDDQLRAVARNGGVVGVGFWSTAVCGVASADIARTVKHAVEVMGDDHVALGSDFDGAVVTGFDTSHMPAVTQALLDAGIPEASIPKILGGNAVRVLRDVLH